MEIKEPLTPFFWKRFHSLAGLWLSIFLFVHLLTNSQAALFFDEAGSGFIKEVNWIHALPFLPILEAVLLGIPIAVHTIWGIGYLRKSKINSFKGDGTVPYMPEARNRAFTWQRLTGAVLAILLIGHIVHMRVIHYPDVERIDGKKIYRVAVSNDPGLYSLQNRISYRLEKPEGDRVVVAADNFGTASLMTVRDVFKSPWMMMIYTLFVLSAVYHGYNGLVTFLISWGVTLSARAQKRAVFVSQLLMGAVGILGLSTIFFTYWITLRN